MTALCDFRECEKTATLKGYCRGHYYQQYRGETLRPLRRRRSPKECVVTDGLRVCADCGEAKPEGLFRIYGSKRTASCRECAKWRHTLNRFGLTRQGYEEILASQGGGCAICGGPEPRANRRLSVDHDHSCCASVKSCGKCVRGILCSRCNTLIGSVGDSAEILTAAIIYLRESKCSP